MSSQPSRDNDGKKTEPDPTPLPLSVEATNVLGKVRIASLHNIIVHTEKQRSYSHTHA